MSDTPTIQPAMTPEEWISGDTGCVYRDVDGVTINVYAGSPEMAFGPDDRHAVAALCLYGQTFGPTPAMLEWVECATTLADHMSDLEPERSQDRQMREQIAEFLRALLPPQEHP